VILALRLMMVLPFDPINTPRVCQESTSGIRPASFIRLILALHRIRAGARSATSVRRNLAAAAGRDDDHFALYKKEASCKNGRLKSPGGRLHSGFGCISPELRRPVG
jgi:hypothetical protein